jgi:hypothetical protein
MISSLLGTIFGCSHKRTTFPLTPTRKSKRSGTYIVCLKCGKEFDYNWKEMRVGSPVGEIPVSAAALQAEQTAAQ